MPRKLPEWIGKTPDASIPPRVKLRVFEAHEGRCHISGTKIMPGMQWHCDHVIPLIEGGENRESNLAPALVQHHKCKTASEVARKAKANRLRQKHLGIEKKKKSQWPCGKDSPLKKKLNNISTSCGAGEGLRKRQFS